MILPGHRSVQKAIDGVAARHGAQLCHFLSVFYFGDYRPVSRVRYAGEFVG